MALATPAQLMERFDHRTLGDMVADNDERVSSADLLDNTRIESALNDASGRIVAALRQGQRYTVAQLATLTGDSKYHLIRLTCDLAFVCLWNRKPYHDNELGEQIQERAEKDLDRLRKGEHVFDVDAVTEAGLPEIVTPTTVETRHLNLLVDTARGSYFPRRRTPYNR
jgi:phage gp36-like protein